MCSRATKRRGVDPGCYEPADGSVRFSPLTSGNDLLGYVERRLRMHAHARRRALRDLLDAGTSDLVQDAMLRLARRGLVRYEDHDHLDASLSRTTRDIVAERARKIIRRRNKLQNAFDAHKPECERTDLWAEDIFEQFEQVNGTDARIARLRLKGGLDWPEVAARVGLSRSSVLRRWPVILTELRRLAGLS